MKNVYIILKILVNFFKIMFAKLYIIRYIFTNIKMDCLKGNKWEMRVRLKFMENHNGNRGKETLIKYSAHIPQSDFSADCTEIPPAYSRMSRDFCAI